MAKPSRITPPAETGHQVGGRQKNMGQPDHPSNVETDNIASSKDIRKALKAPKD
jgi:hypothetical protein